MVSHSASPTERFVERPTSLNQVLLRDWATSLRQQEFDTAIPDSDKQAQLDFEWNEIISLIALLLSEDVEDVHMEAFPQTPFELFREMFTAWKARYYRETAGNSWTQKRIADATKVAADAGASDTDDNDETDAAKASTSQSDAYVKKPEPDGFVPKSKFLPKGHAMATAHAEAVLLDRVRAQLDAHYDDVFQRQWLSKHSAGQDDCGDKGSEPKMPKRRGAHKVDARIMEARAACRYETFRIPSSVKDILQCPADEAVWGKLERLARVTVDLADGLLYATVRDHETLQELKMSSMGQEAGSQGQTKATFEQKRQKNIRLMIADVVVDGVVFEEGARLFNLEDITSVPAQLRGQRPMSEDKEKKRPAWVSAPLTPFGGKLRKNFLRTCPQRLQAIARAWTDRQQDKPGLTSEAVASLLLLDLGIALRNA